MYEWSESGDVTCRRNEGEQNFPEDGEEVHDVVHAGWQLLLRFFVVLFLALVVTCR